MTCPLCGGPLRREALNRFACEVGHHLSGDDLQDAATHRATVALWMAISALETEAELLRSLAADERGARLYKQADEAEKDARLLRDLAAIHDPEISGVGERGEQ